jgi:hypothetical protein
MWRNWSIAPHHDPFVTCRRAIATNWIRSWGGFQGRYGYCDCRHPPRGPVTAPSQRYRLGAVFRRSFIGGAIVHVYSGDLESGVLRNWVALPRDCVATGLDCGHCNGQTENYTLSVLQNTRCEFLFPQSVCRHVLFSLCFYRFSSEMLMGTVFNLSFFFLLFV